MTTAAVKLEQLYVQFIAHAPLEPRAAVAERNGEKRPSGPALMAICVRDGWLRRPHSRYKSPSSCPTWAVDGVAHSGCIEAARPAKAAGKPVRGVDTRRRVYPAYFRPQDG